MVKMVESKTANASYSPVGGVTLLARGRFYHESVPSIPRTAVQTSERGAFSHCAGDSRL